MDGGAVDEDTLAEREQGAAGVDAGVDAGIRWPDEGGPLAATLAREATPEDVATLRGYLVDGRLSTIPAHHRKRQVVLRFLLLERVFTEDRDYPEKEVNQRIVLFHQDVAALRRYLVDDGYVDRDPAGRCYRRRRVTSAP